jgi:hypothetical protein
LAGRVALSIRRRFPLASETGMVVRATGTGDRRGGGGLTRRIVVVCVLLSAVIGTAFILLALAIEILRGSESQANHALEVRGQC